MRIWVCHIITPVIIIFDIRGNSLNIAVLTRSVLSKHACSYYFLVLAFNNVFVSSEYASNTSALLFTSFIILASIDRYYAIEMQNLLVHGNARLRRFFGSGEIFGKYLSLWTVQKIAFFSVKENQKLSWLYSWVPCRSAITYVFCRFF